MVGVIVGEGGGSSGTSARAAPAPAADCQAGNAAVWPASRCSAVMRSSRPAAARYLRARGRLEGEEVRGGRSASDSALRRRPLRRASRHRQAPPAAQPDATPPHLLAHLASTAAGPCAAPPPPPDAASAPPLNVSAARPASASRRPGARLRVCCRMVPVACEGLGASGRVERAVGARRGPVRGPRWPLRTRAPTLRASRSPRCGGCEAGVPLNGVSECL
jgi:hypothetical protein